MGRIYFHIILFSSILWANILLPQSSKYNPSRTFTEPEMLEDITIMERALRLVHPGLFLYNDSAKIDVIFDDLKKSIVGKKFTERQFRLFIMPSVAKISCGHTIVIPSKAYLKYAKNTKMDYFPFPLLCLDTAVYILKNSKKDSSKAEGTRLVSIDKKTAFYYQQEIENKLSGDGFILEGKKNNIQKTYNSFLNALILKPDSFDVEMISPQGKYVSKKLPAAKRTAQQLVKIYPEQDSMFIESKKAAMRFKFKDASRKTGYLRLSAFSSSRYRKTYRKIFKTLNKNKTENLIIDLRGNGGGSLANSTLFLSYFLNEKFEVSLERKIKRLPLRKYTKNEVTHFITRTVFPLYMKRKKVNNWVVLTRTTTPTKKNHFNGKVVVLIDGGSFSASALVAAKLKDANKAKFIGRETGGTYSGSNAGITPYYELPNSKIKIRVPVYRVNHHVSGENTGRGIIPDIEVRYTIEDFLKERDLDLEEALKEIK